MENRDYKIQVLAQNYNCLENGESFGFAECVKLEAQSDPNFYRWLFDDGRTSALASMKMNSATLYKDEQKNLNYEELL